MVNMNEFVRLLNQIIRRFSPVVRVAPTGGTHTPYATPIERTQAHGAGTVSVALRVLLLLTLVTGVLYPCAVTAVAQLVFPTQASGSLIVVGGRVVGSSLVGQAVHDLRYFWPRPSAVDYMDRSAPGALGSSGATNFGPTNATLASQIRQRADALRSVNGLAGDGVVPPDMLFASGSGLDPDISPEAARLQVRRVANERGLPVTTVAALVDQVVEGPQLGIFGEPRVNVLRLNLALDGLQ